MTLDELKRRMPLYWQTPDRDGAWSGLDESVWESQVEAMEGQRASCWAALALLVREALGPEEPLMADLVAVYERAAALADALEAAALEKEATNG